MTPEEKKVMQSFMSDFWTLIKDTYHVSDDEETWFALCDYVSALTVKYRDPDTKIIPDAIVRLVAGWLDYVETEGCGRKRDYINDSHKPGPLELFILDKQV